ncbi:MAG: hypothetical protein WCT77_13760 [Bacteroidota bacterium]
MKKFFYIFAFLFLFASLSELISKGEEFIVLASIGDVQVQRDGKGTWTKLTTGNRLFMKDNIKISGKAYLGMLHIKGGTMEVKKPGVYSASELVKALPIRKSKVFDRLADYLINGVSDKYKRNSSINLGVVRDLPDKIEVNCPTKLSIIGDKVSFSWERIPGNNISYEFVISDRYSNPEFKKTVTDSLIEINAKDLKLKRDEYYFWKVLLASNQELKSDEICFKFLSDRKATDIRDTVSMLKVDFGENNAPAQIVLAVFYERNNLFAEADSAYKEAIRLAPDIDLYKNMYKEFLQMTKKFTDK